MRKFKFILFVLLFMAGVSASSQVLTTGVMAPDFTLTADDGSTLRLSDFRGKNVVLYFYPQDMSSGCRLQAVYFRDNLNRFTDANSVVLGVSTDNVASHQTFKTTENLNFPLLADVDGSISRTYGVLNPETNRANRVTYIINPQGQIVQVYENVDPNTNYVQILDYLGAPAPVMDTRITDATRYESTTMTTVRTTQRRIVVRKLSYFAVTPYGGAIFPMDRAMRDVFKPGWSAGLDLMYRVNREVAIWAGASYSQMTRKTAEDVGHYFEASIGPRYFFTHPRLKSQVFLDAGVGMYNLNEDEDIETGEEPGEGTPEYTIAQIDGSKVGINGGVGATLFLSKSVHLLGKVRYNTVFGTNENVSFINGGLGIEFRF